MASDDAGADDERAEARATVALPRLGEPAPQFTAASTLGDIRLSDHAGRWVVLFSHPADFTPVCTSELIAFARAQPDFAAAGAQLIGLSIDSVYAHLAWLRAIEERFGVKVTFPIIADHGAEVARRYGMIHPGASSTATVRAVFVIDPRQVVRAIVYYPMTVGRMVGEILRLLRALQVNAADGLATPEGWQPGQACIVPPPATLPDLEKRLASEHRVVDWYFATTKP